MPITHTFVNPLVDEPGFLGVKPSNWNGEAAHTVNIVNADIDPAAGIAESKLALNSPTHALLTLDTANGLSLVGQALSLALASSGITGALSGADWATFNGKQSALTFPLASTLGGTGVNNAGTLTNASNTTIIGGGTVALGGFTLTVPATGTAALLATANVFTALQTIDTTAGATVDLLVKMRNYQDTAGAGVSAIQLQNTRTENSVFSRIAGLNAASQMVGGIEFIANNQAEQTGSIRFVTFNAGTAATGLVMSSVGRVGVGTSPSHRFHVLGGSSQRAMFEILTTINSTDNDIQLTVIGHTTQSFPVAHIRTNDTTTNAVREAMRLESRVSTASTGGAAGFGPSQSFYAETATDATNQQQGLISTSWIDATNTSRKAKMSLSAYDTAEKFGASFEANGTSTNAISVLGAGAGKITLSAPSDVTLTVPASLTPAGLAIANVFTTQQMVDGTSDQIQLRVQAHSTQTARLQTWENSGGTVLAAVNHLGFASFGSTPFTNVVLRSNTTTAAASIVSMQGELYIGGDHANCVALKGLMSLRANTTVTADNAPIAVRGDIEAIQSRTNAEATSFAARLIINGAGATEVLTRWNGLAILTPTIGGSNVITNAYGVYVYDQNIGSTLNFAIFTNLGNNSFGDDIILRNDSDKIRIGALSTGDLNLYHDGTNSFIFNDTGILKIQDAGAGIWVGTATTELISFYGGTAVARGAALTTQLTTITHTAPGTPDYAVQDLIDSSAGAAFGFATKDEGNTVLSVVRNLQIRVAELEARLGSATGVNLFA